jgi:hypothetical protein
MKNVIAAVLIFLSANLLKAQTIPTFNGETLENKQLTIPKDTKGKYTFLCFASSIKAQKDLETWLDPVYNKFIAKTGLMDEFYDVNVFFIPVFKGSNASMQESIRKKFSDTAQDDVRGNVLFCKNDLSEVMKTLSISDDNTPYFFLLNPEGTIIYRASGPYSDAKFEKIDDLIE